MHVLCLRPPQVIAADSATTHLCPPLGLASVATALRDAGHQVSVLDAVATAPGHAVRFRPGVLAYGLGLDTIAAHAAALAPDIVAVSVMFSQDWPVARAAIAAIAAACPTAHLVAGGEHVSAIPEICLDSCPALDACVIGEGEVTVVEWLAAVSGQRRPDDVAGMAFRTPDGVRRTTPRARAPIRDLARPDWSLFPLEAYLDRGLSYGVNRGRTYPILASRGCPYSCSFCSSPAMWTTLWKARPVEDVFDEMSHAMARYGVTAFDFYDLTAIIRRDWILAFCRGIVERGWRISWQMPAGTRVEALDRDVLEWLARSGHRFAVFAPECGSARTRALIGKKVDIERMAALVREGAALGLDIKLNIIMGHPSETASDLWATVRLLVRFAWLGATDTFAAAFTPYPGSSNFRELRDAGRLPALDDEYFLSLTSVGALWRAPSYAPAVSRGLLTAFRIGGMAAFYAVSYLRRPERILRLIRDLWRGEESSRLALALNDMRHRRATLDRPAEAPATRA